MIPTSHNETPQELEASSDPKNFEVKPGDLQRCNVEPNLPIPSLGLISNADRLQVEYFNDRKKKVNKFSEMTD